MVDLLREVGLLLSQHGGWGLAVVAFYAVYWLYVSKERAMEQLRAEYNESMEVRHKEFTSLLRETQDALTSVASIIQKCQGPNDGE